jgi:hypothetical protein
MEFSLAIISLFAIIITKACIEMASDLLLITALFILMFDYRDAINFITNKPCRQSGSWLAGDMIGWLASKEKPGWRFPIHMVAILLGCNWSAGIFITTLTAILFKHC